MNKGRVTRPRSVTWIAWLIIGGPILYFVIVLFVGASWGEIIATPNILNTIIPLFIIQMIIGIGMLKSQNWARLLWLFLGVGYLISASQRPSSILADFYNLVWVFSLFLLNTSTVKAYFKGTKVAERKNSFNKDNIVDTKMVKEDIGQEELKEFFCYHCGEMLSGEEESILEEMKNCPKCGKSL